ncbi:hypothetical protein LBMAG42_42440 [Deltaproteobacteria bacterium]|nr:hypothetical protein LBMAG42_42440 [Deltaproteobacteria bacterium]
MPLLMLALFAGCPGTPDNGTSTIDCAAEAIDSCDEAACDACVAACGTTCASDTEYPPEWNCDQGAWDAYTECPDWGNDQQ